MLSGTDVMLLDFYGLVVNQFAVETGVVGRMIESACGGLPMVDQVLMIRKLDIIHRAVRAVALSERRER